MECGGHPQENPSAPTTGGKILTLCVLARADVTPCVTLGLNSFMANIILLIESAANVQTIFGFPTLYL